MTIINMTLIRNSISWFILIYSVSNGFAQERSISGTIRTTKGIGIPGVKILAIKGRAQDEFDDLYFRESDRQAIEENSGNQAISNQEGEYRIVIGDETALFFLHDDYSVKKIRIGSNVVIDMRLNRKSKKGKAKSLTK